MPYRNDEASVDGELLENVAGASGAVSDSAVATDHKQSICPETMFQSSQPKTFPRSDSIFDDTPFAQIQHHVHHHTHQHLYTMEAAMTPSADERNQGQDSGGSPTQGMDAASEINLAPEMWEPDYPVLTPDFYDNQGRVVRKLRRNSEKVAENEVPVDDKRFAPTRLFFRINRVMWRGYFSMVLEGVMRCNQKKMAIKMISKTCTDDKRNQVITEHRILSNHSRASSFVVDLHSSFQTPLHVYLIMEFIEGGTLEQRLRAVGVHPERVVVFYMAEICLGLFFLHQRGILHRDLRLKNVMIKQDGHIRIIDFGLAKTNMKNNFTDTMVGTVKEMAPEMHYRTMYNKSVDYWSMGIMLYTMVHGELPFKGKTRVDIFKIVTQKPEVYDRRLRDDTVDLCRQLLQKNQKVRLGYEDNSEEVYKNHPFFYSVDWERLAHLFYAPPYLPGQDRDESGVTEATWPDLAEQNIVFSGKGVPRRLSLAGFEESGESKAIPNFRIKAPPRGSVTPIDFSPLLHIQARHGSLVTGSLMDPGRGSQDLRMTLGRLTRNGSITSTLTMQPAAGRGGEHPHSNMDTLLESQVGSKFSRHSNMRAVAARSTGSIPVIMMEDPQVNCCHRCWSDCSTSMGNACRNQAVTCKALFCGLENVKPPVFKKRPSVVAYALSDSMDEENHRQFLITGQAMSAHWSHSNLTASRTAAPVDETLVKDAQ
ncbi:hypothetical protein V1264_001685 [Littorina saxatilis]|uniref:Protein kinase domain-containing protein n=2 Tax=Littorina saxatilis TaxID=31220 RepID=A0AAN9C1Y9_9CAEN